jgi:hypothetical protein
LLVLAIVWAAIASVVPEAVKPVTAPELAVADQANEGVPELFDVSETGVEAAPLQIDCAKLAFVTEGVPITVTAIAAGLLGHPF